MDRQTYSEDQDGVLEERNDLRIEIGNLKIELQRERQGKQTYLKIIFILVVVIAVLLLLAPFYFGGV